MPQLTPADWALRLRLALSHLKGPDGVARYVERAPAAYRERLTPQAARSDLAELAALAASVELEASSEPSSDDPGTGLGGIHRLVVGVDAVGVDTAFAGDALPGSFRLRRYGSRALELSAAIPVLESFGLVVVEELPAHVHLGDHPSLAVTVHVDDFGVHPSRHLAAGRFDPLADGARLVAALEAVVRGWAETDSLNRLVIAAGLDWTEVVVLRAYRRYRQQLGSTLEAEELDDPLVAFPEVARALLAYFAARFDPAGGGDVAVTRAKVEQELVPVPDLADDVVLRGYLALMDATTRTTFFAHRPRGAGLAIKLDGAALPRVPHAPRAPMPIEAFVHTPAVEGIHLRAGAVARGGIRWSVRPADLRTEVLELAEAQLKKNAIIVPTGAKGGFVLRSGQPPTREAVGAAYEVFIGELLDLTDNLVGGKVVPPPEVVPADGDDPYLVVAADKGTAAFSDRANQLAIAKGFWLGDAFASGGSHGYDHKAMGITARGAWLAVRQHFRQLGLDPDRDPLRCVGVGDMSGDVFGSGMLRSEALLLVGAFDGRHVFLDPAPDPQASFAERQRLAGLPASSWDDYDRSLISEGGGVWPRDAKAIPLSRQARSLLGSTAEQLSPPEVISALLGASVDLLFFGGVGTFVKAPGEADSEVGDPANEALRVTADQVRARVIAEGANLAVTQRARVRYSRHGGRVNTDFVDNSAGVATSDREVNLKILLALAMDEGRLEAQSRNELLASLEGQVADAVLHQVGHSVSLLSWAVPESAAELDAYRALAQRLGAAGLDPAAEALPDDEELDRRRSAGAGLTRPELAVLMAYTKNSLARDIEASPLPAEPAVEEVVAEYFPPALRARFGDLVPRHRLYPQLAATDLAGEVVDRMGIVWAHETADELDRSAVDSVAAFWAANLVLGAGGFWRELDAEGAAWPLEVEEKVAHRLRQSLAGLSRWYLVKPGPVRLGELLNNDQPLARRWLEGAHPDASLAERVELTARVATALPAAESLPGGALALDEVIAAGDQAERLVGLDLVRAALEARPTGSRWNAWQARALLDEVAQWRASLVPDLLAGRAAAWEERLGRCRFLAAGLADDPSQVLVRAALVLRSLRRADVRPSRG